MKIFSTIAQFTVVLALVISCTKKRPEEFLQGTDEGLAPIDQLSISGTPQEFEIQTHGEIARSHLSSAQTLDDDQMPEQMRNFRLVNYSTKSSLLEDIPIRGLQNHTYKMRLEFTDNSVVVKKLGTEKEIPFQERTYATKLPNGLLAVPLVSYPVTFYRVENVLDRNNDKTRRIMPVQVKSVDQATHYKIDLFTRTVFEAVKKNDVFPVEYFDGEWFYSVTVVKSHLQSDSGVIDGANLSRDFKFDPVSRIKFLRKPTVLRGVNTNLDKELDRTDEMNLVNALDLSIDWVDYTVNRKGRNFQMKEELIDKKHLKSVEDTQKPYVKVDFSATKNGALLGLFGSESNYAAGIKNSNLENIEVTEKYFSFTVLYVTGSDSFRIKYSFLRAHQPKLEQAKNYSDQDFKYYGFFASEQHFIRNHKMYREEDFKKKIFINRFMPSETGENGDKVIRYYFSTNSPRLPHIIRAARRSIEAWDQAFEKAFSHKKNRIRVVLDESKQVAIGDLRYNIMNIIDSKESNGLLGYGPAIMDSESGEIVSATTNIYTFHYRQGLIENVRNYIKLKLGHLNLTGGDLSSLSLSPTKLNKFAQSQGLQDRYFLAHAEEILKGKNPFMSQSLSKIEFENDGKFKLIDRVFSDINKESSFRSTKTDYNKNVAQSFRRDLVTARASQHIGNLEQYGSSCSYQVSHANIIKKIENVCGKSLDSYISNLKNANLNYDNSSEIAVIESCAEELLEDELVATIIHELGHNFGLRHNFKGSYDKSNFSYDEEGKLLGDTSSTMDYLQVDTSLNILVPGLYDIEAIRYGYADSITLKNNAPFELDISKSIDAQLAEKNLEKRKFEFCTDQHSEYVPGHPFYIQSDPMCRKFDKGTTPSEVVDYLYNRFKTDAQILGQRYDRANMISSARFAMMSLSRTLIPLRQIYEEWRHQLREHVNKRNQYLNRFSEKDIPEVLKSMQNSPKHSKSYNDYYEASQKVFKILSELAFSPAYTCVVANNQTKDLIVLDFELIQAEVANEQNGVVVNSCSDPRLKSYFSNKGVSYVYEAGTLFNSNRRSLDYLDPYYDQFDSIGFKEVRGLAFMILNVRAPMLKQSVAQNFYPNVLDDPRYRSFIATKIFSRSVNGLTPTDLNFQSQQSLAPIAKRKDVAFPLFKTEADLYSDMYAIMMQSLSVPNEPDISMQRITPFMFNRTMDRRILSPTDVSVEHLRAIYYTDRSNPGAMLITKLNLLKRMQMFESIGLGKVNPQKVMDVYKKQLPSIMPSLQVAQNWKMSEMLKHLISIRKGLSDLSKRGDQISLFMFSTFFEVEMNILQIIEQNLKEIQTELKNEDPLFTELLAKLSLPQPATQMSFYTQDGLTQRLASTEKFFNEMVPAVADFSKNYDEYLSQINLISEMIIGSAMR